MASAVATNRNERADILSLHAAGRTWAFLDAAWRRLAGHPADEELAIKAAESLAEIGLGGPARELLSHVRAQVGRTDDGTACRQRIASSATGRVDWAAQSETASRNLECALASRPHLREALAGVVNSSGGGPFPPLPLGEGLGVRALAVPDALHGRNPHPALSQGEPVPERAIDSPQFGTTSVIERLDLVSIEHDLFRDDAGGWQVSRREQGALRRWIPGLVDHKQIRAALPGAGDLQRTALVVGLLPGTALEHLWRAQSAPEAGRSFPLVVVEPDLARIAAWLYTDDHTELLADERVLIFAGEHAGEQLQQFYEANPDVDLPAVCITLHAADGVAEVTQRVIAHIGRQREQAQRADLTALHERANGRTGAFYADRLRHGGCIVALTSRFTTMLQHSTRDIAAALRRLGHRVHIVSERADWRQVTSQTIARAMREHDPDLVLMLNHARRELPGLLGEAPVLTWIQDPVPALLNREAGASIGPRDFVGGYYARRLSREFNYPATQLFSTPVPVDTQLFHDGPVESSDADAETCDLVYVSHLNETPEAYVLAMRTQTDASLHALFDALVADVRRRIDDDSGCSTFMESQRVVRQCASERGTALDEAGAESLARFHHRLFDLHLRLQTVRWAAAWAERNGRTFHIHGRGWDAHPEFACHARGEVEHGEPLRCVYRRAPLALHVMPGGFRHQRPFEALASGCLVLTRRSVNDSVSDDADAGHASERLTIRRYNELLQRGEDPVMVTDQQFPRFDDIAFASEAEFIDRAERCLTDAAHRTEVLSALRQTVHEDFSYDCICDALMDTIITRLDEAP